MAIQAWAALVLQFFDAVNLVPWGQSVSPAQQVLETVEVHNLENSPVFAPPNGALDIPFLCNYTAMGSGWLNCSKPDDRTCWLNGPDGATYDINTDYEKDYPTGILRQV